MKFLLFPFLIVLLFSVSTDAQEPCKRHVESKPKFSFCAPEGWTSEVRPGTKYHSFFPSSSNATDTPAGFTVQEFRFGGPVELLAKADLMTSSKSGREKAAKVVSSATFAVGKVKGLRRVSEYEYDGKLIKGISYFLQGSGQSTIWFSANMPRDDAATPKLLDAMILTFDSTPNLSDRFPKYVFARKPQLFL